jgi:ribosomal protein S6--L-glutamate ligase
MKFLILSRLPEIYSTRRLVEEIQDRNLEVFVEHPDSDFKDLEGDLLIPRLGSFRYTEALEKLREFARRHPETRILNPPEAFHKARHKKIALEVLKDLPHPTLYDGPLTFPIVIKECTSGQGEGVFLCRSSAEVPAILQRTQGHELLFQEFIAESAGHDVRAFVIGPRITASMERHSVDPEKEFRSNLSLGGYATPATLTKEEQEMCLTAVKKLGLDYAGVDFLRSRRGPLLLEVNPCPGFEGIEQCSGLNITEEIVLYAESLLRSHSQR